MKSRTSFSKLTPFKKNLTRFAPIWALYLIGMVLVLINELSYGDYTHRATILPDLIMAFGVVNVIYAAICALMLYGDLYNTRMCYSLHALPQRRETWLLSHFAAGMAFSLVPNCIAALLLMARLGSYGYLALYWLLAAELQFLFFFGVATVSAMLTGNRIGMLLVYAGLNFVSMLVYWIVDTIYLPMLEGVVLDMAPYKLLCPVVQLFEHEYMEFERIVVTNGGFYDAQYKFLGLSDGWGYMAILGVLGLVLMGVATLLYRLRHLESAGDFLAFPKLKGLMCVVMTVCVGGGFAFIGDELMGDSMLLWLIVGLVLGWFGGMMLLERRLKVFRGKTFIGFGVLAAVLIVSTLLISADVFGIVRWLPDADRVQSVTVANYNSDRNYYYDGLYSGNRIAVTLEDLEEIEDIIEAHQDIIDRLNVPSENSHRVVISYKLKSGRTVKRSYAAPASGTNYEIISRYFYTPENILGFTDWDSWVKSVVGAGVGSADIPKEYMEEFLQALLEDCKNGAVLSDGPYSEKNMYAYLETQLSNGNYNYRELIITKDAHNVAAFLKKPQVILGFTDWDAYLDSIEAVYVDGLDVKPAHFQGLLEAVLADCEKGTVSLMDDEVHYYLEILTRDSRRYLAIPSNAENTIAYLQEHILN